jgi:hypothetical protein
MLSGDAEEAAQHLGGLFGILFREKVAGVEPVALNIIRPSSPVRPAGFPWWRPLATYDSICARPNGHETTAEPGNRFLLGGYACALLSR